MKNISAFIIVVFFSICLFLKLNEVENDINISTNVDAPQSEISFFSDFKKKLATCDYWQGNELLETLNGDFNFNYYIKGKKDSLCSFEIEMTSPFFNLLAECELSDEDVNTYLKKMKLYEKYTDEQSRRRYLRNITKLMYKNCDVHHKEINFVQDILDNLTECNPVMSEQKILNGEIQRKIYGVTENGNCEVSYVQLWRDTKIYEYGQILPLGFKCELSKEEISEYKKILEKKILPDADVKNTVENLDALNLEEEVGFFTEVCGETIDAEKLFERKLP